MFKFKESNYYYSDIQRKQEKIHYQIVTGETCVDWSVQHA